MLSKAEEVFHLYFPSRHQSAIVLHPGKEPLDLSTAAITTQRSVILSFPLAVDAVVLALRTPQDGLDQSPLFVIELPSTRAVMNANPSLKFLGEFNYLVDIFHITAVRLKVEQNQLVGRIL